LYRNWLPLILSIPVLAFVAGYPYLKRFSRLCHYYLGPALALAPICAAIAIAARSRSIRSSWRRRALLDGRLRHHLRLPGL
jgi:4-hydroxybenzoate polyprenyltransferase